MLGRLNVIWKIALLVAMSQVILLGIVGVTAYQQVEAVNDDEVRVLQEHVDTLKGIADRIQRQVEAGALTAEAGRAQFTNALYGMRYRNGTGYMWAYSYEGVSLGSGDDPKEAGQNLWDIQDKYGKHILQDIVRVARAGGGTTDYHWPKAGGTVPELKRSYVAAFEPWKIAIGTGLYWDHIQARQAGIIFNAAIVLVVSSAALYALAFWIGRDLQHRDPGGRRHPDRGVRAGSPRRDRPHRGGARRLPRRAAGA
jgi:methyl-accepting chemotaxis protein